MSIADDRNCVLHVKDMFAADALRQIRERIRCGFSSSERVSVSAKDLAASVRGEAGAETRLDPFWYRIWQPQSVLKPEALGPFRWVIYPPQIRMIQTAKQEVRWHQDAGFVKVMPRQHERIITCFVPLDDNPAERCTLQFTREQCEFLEHAPTSNGFAAGLDRDFGAVYHFNLALGDCLLFGDFAPHRSYAPRNCIWERLSMEFRVIAPEHALLDKDYFDVNSGEFVAVDRASPIAVPLD